MIPHISLLLSVLHPVGNVALLARGDRQRLGRDALTNRAAAADVRAFADRYRRHQLRVAADERAVLDRRLVLLLAVEIAGDGAGADIHLLADHGIPEVRQVAGLGA